MKKQLIIYIALLSSILVYSQGEVSLGGDSAPSKNGGTVTACHKITLTPGFTYKAVANKPLNLKLTPTTCDPFDGKDVDATAIKGENYIRTKTYLNSDQSRYLDEIQYFDGLGRPIQTVQRGITPGAKDLATYQEYDPAGRESLAWLPGVVGNNNGKLVPYETVVKQSQATNGDKQPYIKPIYEASPLNRITAQFGPGEAWANNPSTTDYLTNDQTDTFSCYIYTVGGTRQVPTISKGNKYAIGELYVTKVTDEDKNPSYEFKDKLGQVVLTRQVADGANYDTYYAYDDYGNLCFVVPPMGDGKVDATTLGLYAYQYKYNDRNLCISKKLPGCDWVHYVYDKGDRLILSQDGEQRDRKEWLFSLPDAFGRIVLTGICKNTVDHTKNPLQSVVVKAEWKNKATDYKGYEVTGITIDAKTSTILTTNYYDNYEFLGLNSVPKYTYDDQKGTEYKTAYGTDTNDNYKSKGLLTGSITALLDNSGKSLYSVIYYDQKGQPVQSQSSNHAGGKESEYIVYNFTEQPTKKMHIHTHGTSTQTELYTYEYDHAGRLLATKHKLNTGTTVVLAQNTYDDLGRLKSTTANNQSALTTNYTYNVRSWTKSISNPLFSQTLYYNDAVKAHSYSDYKGSYTGNISGEEWSIQGEAKRSHRFKYDGLSRLIHSAYNGVISGGTYNTSYSYDKHGNVLTLARNSGTKGMIDNLTFKYDGTGNQVKFITDAYTAELPPTSADFKQNKSNTSPYAYNKNGAMTYDPNKGMNVVYNSLNLPQELLINGQTARGKNYYTYTATGAKLQVKHLSDPTLQTVPVTGTSADSKYKVQNTTDYIGNRIYENGVLNKTLIDNGYIEGNNYYFYMRDHLGNNRIVASATGAVIQRNNYYPFGMSFGEESGEEQGMQNFKYNGKELDKEHGLNQYDYAARFMDPGMIRFTSVDPLAEKYYSISPYAYTFNNPLRFIDDDGKAPGDVVVAFGGADIMNNHGKGLASDIINNINQNLFTKEGGSAQAFSSQYWGTNIRSSSDLDKATQTAYDYIIDNHNMNNGEKVEGGRIVIEGYSFGGVLASHLTKRLDKTGISVDLLVTVDAAAGPSSAFVDRTISSNVKENQNFYQTTRSTVLSRGAENKALNTSKTSVDNTNMSGNSSHSSIDDNTFNVIIDLINNKLKKNENETTKNH